MRKMLREMSACALWVAANITFAFGITDSDRVGHNSVALACGLFLAVVALIPTGWIIIEKIERERQVTVDEIIRIAASVVQDRQQVTPMR